ncbi:hypothetical protein LOC68_06330 [Blastopirellula sp. JC732]|uniref:J domain-containing protein n=1 Tax=Blastopirellula sediminis TaxID=2894196 RepID=A0A9X1MKP3_9BACT|nr:hypothetical protein [Blastopirellula sediminis]MCC9609218.1 hypothetical protein [Blastopirellula sediminis]MCC9628005.1 hypothetical protein [Blastopirellula sediminis]
MTDPNNPYFRWLGLSVYGRPDYYALLGLRTFETDPQTIAAYGEQTFLRVQTQHGGAEEASRQQILQEISAARACLQNPALKAVYDQQLQQYYAQYGGAQYAAPQYGGNPGYPAAPQGNPMAPAGNYPGPQGGGYGAGPAMPTPPAPEPSAAEPPVQVGGGSASAAKRAKSRAKGGSRLFWASALSVLALGGAAAGGYVYWQSIQPEEEVAEAEPELPTPTTEELDETDESDGKKKKDRKYLSGKRPTAEELAGSIPSLGDPNERMNEMGEMPKPQPPAKPQPTAAEKTQLEGAIQTAWQHLAAGDFSAAQTTLAGVSSLNKTDDGEAEFKRIDQLAKNLVAFHSAVDASLAKLQGGEQLQVGTTEFSVVSKTPSHLVLRVAGQSKSYELATLPEGLRRALALYSLPGDEAQKKLVEGSFLLFSSIADPNHAMDVWKEAASQGADISSYVALVDEKKRYAPAPRTMPPTVAMVEEPATTPTMTTPTAMTPEPMTPATTPPAMAPVVGDDKANAVKLGQMLTAAKQALVERRPQDAQRILTDAAPLATLPEHQEKTARLQKLADNIQQFWTAVSEEIAGLTADTDITVGSTVARVVENRADYLVLRLNGENKRYTLSDMPAGLAMHFATEHMTADEGEAKTIRGSFLFVSPDGGADRADAMWTEAKLAGADLGDLPQIISDNYDLADDLLVQVPVPADDTLMEATTTFQGKWAASFSSAKRASDHILLAKKLLDEGKSIEGDPELQFVTFRYALAEAAKGGELPLCNEIVIAWAKRFTIDPLEWDLKSFQLAAASESSQQQERVAQYALTLAPRLAKAGRHDEAVAVAKTAETAAKKARNKELIDQIEQLQSSL